MLLLVTNHDISINTISDGENFQRYNILLNYMFKENMEIVLKH